MSKTIPHKHNDAGTEHHSSFKEVLVERSEDFIIDKFEEKTEEKLGDVFAGEIDRFFGKSTTIHHLAAKEASKLLVKGGAFAFVVLRKKLREEHASWDGAKHHILHFKELLHQYISECEALGYKKFEEFLWHAIFHLNDFVQEFDHWYKVNALYGWKHAKEEVFEKIDKEGHRQLALIKEYSNEAYVMYHFLGDKEELCPKKHPMHFIIHSKNHFRCDKCTHLIDGPFYGCDDCNYDVCGSCHHNFCKQNHN
jgi:hypothetical protein